jgi:hypothetical protein
VGDPSRHGCSWYAQNIPHTSRGVGNCPRAEATCKGSPPSLLIHPESAKLTFSWHGHASDGGAVRAVPRCRKHPVFPAWSRPRQTKFAKKTFNLESPTPILTSQFPPEPPKMMFSRHGDAPTGGALYPRQQLPPSPTSWTAGFPAGQARVRRLQVRAAIVDTKWHRRANTVWKRQIRIQLPCTAVPPPPAAPGRGGGNTRWVRGRSVLGCLGFWLGCSAKG